eukprot:6090510-Pleurochrysis_carterae.AAC.1
MINFFVRFPSRSVLQRAGHSAVASALVHRPPRRPVQVVTAHTTRHRFLLPAETPLAPAAE